MRRRYIALFLLLFGFWLVIAGEADWEHILVGAVVALVTVWLWKDLVPQIPVSLSARGIMLFGRCLSTLIWSIVDSAISVTKTVVFGKPPVKPVMLTVRPALETNWGRVFLGNCITLTPGSVTIDINPETGVFTIHALNPEIAEGLCSWKIIDEIRALELWGKERVIHAPAAGGSYGVDSFGTLASDHGSDGS
ncbi:MAG: Na+/H+ antiporter subunit E [Firmicutes bacterium]|nr:Na+/H+ antiporter subunit E [Bacillota bacterium]